MTSHTCVMLTYVQCDRRRTVRTKAWSVVGSRGLRRNHLLALGGVWLRVVCCVFIPVYINIIYIAHIDLHYCWYLMLAPCMIR